MHAIRTLPRYVGSRLRPREIVNLSLSLDHRHEVREILEAADFPGLSRDSA